MILTINSDSNIYIYTLYIDWNPASLYWNPTSLYITLRSALADWGFDAQLCASGVGVATWRCSSTTKCWTRNHRVIAVISIDIPTYGGFNDSYSSYSYSHKNPNGTKCCNWVWNECMELERAWHWPRKSMETLMYLLWDLQIAWAALLWRGLIHESDERPWCSFLQSKGLGLRIFPTKL